MALLRLNLGGPDMLALQGSAQSARAALWRAARGTGPITLMLHGFKYDPADPAHCPHERIFGPHSGWASCFGGTEDHGIGVALGWPARGRFGEVFARAQGLGQDLAAVIAGVHSLAPQRPVHLVAHSLGAELALSALAAAPARSVSRMVLLTGAALVSRARAALDSPAGRHVELVNVVSRENDLFDYGFERLAGSPLPGDRAIGAGLAGRNVANLQLDCPVTLARLATLGFPMAPSRRRICHWSSYTRPGALSFYARFLNEPERLPLSLLRHLAPPDAAPRWSRLRRSPQTPLAQLASGFGLRLNILG